MIDHDYRIERALDALVARPAHEPGAWDRILADSSPSRPKRLAVAVLLAALATLVPLTALAVGNGWWFLHAGPGLKPRGAVVVAARGSWQGVPWALTSYMSRSEGLCLAFTPNPPAGRARHRIPPGAQACGASIRGVPGPTRPAPNAPAASRQPGRERWLGYFGSWSEVRLHERFPGFIAGPTAAGVARVDVVLVRGAVRSTPTFAAPSALGLPVRFYLVKLPDPARVAAVVAYDRSGHVLERLRLPPLAGGVIAHGARIGG